jgi:hypothetical protein
MGKIEEAKVKVTERKVTKKEKESGIMPGKIVLKKRNKK